MLTAEENIVLPLSIAGEKPEPEFFEDLLAARRSHRSAQAPAVRALRRPAAARRDRPRARLEADGRLRRRADRQPRLDDGAGDPRAAAQLGAGARADDGDGHARRARRRRSPIACSSSPTAGSSRSCLAARPWRSSRRWAASAHDQGRARGPARPQASHRADGDRDRARRRDGQRHVRPHRLDRQGVQLDLHRRPQGLRPSSSAASRRSTSRRARARSRRRCTSRCSTRCAPCPVSRRSRGASTARRRWSTRRARRSSSAARRTSASASRTRSRRSTRCGSSQARGRTATRS